MKDEIQVQYILKYTDPYGSEKEKDVTSDFTEWSEFKSQITRDDLTGAFITINEDGIYLSGDSYNIVKWLFYSVGVTAVASIYINVRKNTFPDVWTYENKVILNLNFSTYNEDRSTINISANENGLKAMIKANNSQTYDIAISDLSPETLVYDGLEIKESLSWFTGYNKSLTRIDFFSGTEPISTSENQIWVKNIAPQAYFYKSELLNNNYIWVKFDAELNSLFIYHYIEDNIEKDKLLVYKDDTLGIILYTILNYDEYIPFINCDSNNVVEFCPAFVILDQNINANYNNYLVQEDQHISKYDSVWKYFDYDSKGWYNYSELGSNFPYIIERITRKQFGVLINGILQVSLITALGDIGASVRIVLKGDSSNEEIDITTFNFIDSGNTISIQEFTLNESIYIPSSYVSTKFYIKVYATTSGGGLYPLKFEFKTGSYLNVWWYALPKRNVNVNVISEQSLAQSLINKITNTTGVYTALVDSHSEMIRIASGESIRNFPSQKIHTSINSFINYMRSCWGYEYDIYDTTIRFRHRDNLYDKTVVKSITETNNYKVSINTSFLYSGVKVGISKVSYDTTNGTDEFRFSEEWSTGVTQVTNKLDLTNPYRTDAFGFQLLSDKQYDASTNDDESDNSVFVLHVKQSGSNLILDRTATISGVISPSTMFNAIFSPRKCLERNMSLLGITSNVLKFTSSEGNSDISINGVSEKSDIVISNKLLSPIILETDIGEITSLPQERNSLVSILVGDDYYFGFIKKLEHSWGKNKKTSGTFYCAPDNFSCDYSWINDVTIKKTYAPIELILEQTGYLSARLWDQVAESELTINILVDGVARILTIEKGDYSSNFIRPGDEEPPFQNCSITSIVPESDSIYHYVIYDEQSDYPPHLTITSKLTISISELFNYLVLVDEYIDFDVRQKFYYNGISYDEITKDEIETNLETVDFYKRQSDFIGYVNNLYNGLSILLP